LLVDDHLMFREHLRDLISRSGGMKVCGEAESAACAMELVRQAKPDVAIVDITLRGSNGLDLVKQLSEEAPEVKILVLSMHEESLYAERALRAGARGYLTKHQTSSAVVETIQRIVGGEVCVRRLGDHPEAEESTPAWGRSVEETLAGRELEVFRLLGGGKGTREIAVVLEIAESTVETYRSRIKEKLGLRSAAQLYVRAGNWLREQGG
jgi:DNA-binding NarL/FixJ family response regulator